MSFIEEAPKPVGKWCQPREFDESKQIQIINFELLTPEEVNARDGRFPKFPPDPALNRSHDGKIRRLTFHDVKGNRTRTMDHNSIRFQNDLAKFGIKKGDIGILERIPRGQFFDWKWTHIGHEANASR